MKKKLWMVRPLIINMLTSQIRFTRLYSCKIWCFIELFSFSVIPTLVGQWSIVEFFYVAIVVQFIDLWAGMYHKSSVQSQVLEHFGCLSNLQWSKVCLVVEPTVFGNIHYFSQIQILPPAVMSSQNRQNIQKWENLGLQIRFIQPNQIL